MIDQDQDKEEREREEEKKKRACKEGKKQRTHTHYNSRQQQQQQQQPSNQPTTPLLCTTNNVVYTVFVRSLRILFWVEQSLNCYSHIWKNSLCLSFLFFYFKARPPVRTNFADRLIDWLLDAFLLIAQSCKIAISQRSQLTKFYKSQNRSIFNLVVGDWIINSRFYLVVIQSRRFAAAQKNLEEQQKHWLHAWWTSYVIELSCSSCHSAILPTVSKFPFLEIYWSTFLHFRKFADRRILRLWNCEIIGRVQPYAIWRSVHAAKKQGQGWSGRKSRSAKTVSQRRLTEDKWSEN